MSYDFLCFPLNQLWHDNNPAFCEVLSMQTIKNYCFSWDIVHIVQYYNQYHISKLRF